MTITDCLTTNVVGQSHDVDMSTATSRVGRRISGIVINVDAARGRQAAVGTDRRRNDLRVDLQRCGTGANTAGAEGSRSARTGRQGNAVSVLNRNGAGKIVHDVARRIDRNNVANRVGSVDADQVVELNAPTILSTQTSIANRNKFAGFSHLCSCPVRRDIQTACTITALTLAIAVPINIYRVQYHIASYRVGTSVRQTRCRIDADIRAAMDLQIGITLHNKVVSRPDNQVAIFTRISTFIDFNETTRLDDDVVPGTRCQLKGARTCRSRRADDDVARRALQFYRPGSPHRHVAVDDNPTSQRQ